MRGSSTETLTWFCLFSLSCIFCLVFFLCFAFACFVQMQLGWWYFHLYDIECLVFSTVVIKHYNKKGILWQWREEIWKREKKNPLIQHTDLEWLFWGGFLFLSSHYAVFIKPKKGRRVSANEILTVSCTSVLGAVISHLLSVPVSFSGGQSQL